MNLKPYKYNTGVNIGTCYILGIEPKCSMKKCVLSIVLKDSVEFALRTAEGRLFHKNGAILLKAR